MSEEAKRCETNAMGTCDAASPIYVASNHRLCVFKLFRGDKKRIEDSCQILTNTVLPQFIRISDKIWVVATQVGSELSEVCEGHPTRTIKLISPLFIIELLMGCSTSGMSISPPTPYYQTEEKFEEKKSFVKLHVSKKFLVLLV